MAGRSVSGYVDETVATRLASLARAEARTPASLVGQATSFYVGLPEAARSAIRRLDQMASREERRHLEAEIVRILLRADFALTQRLMADEVRDALPEGDTEGDVEAAAIAFVGSQR